MRRWGNNVQNAWKVIYLFYILLFVTYQICICNCSLKDHKRLLKERNWDDGVVNVQHAWQSHSPFFIFFFSSLTENLRNKSNAIFHYTGWPKSKSVISNGCASKAMHFWPYVGKAKMCLRGGSFFWKIVNKQLKNVNKI